MNSHLAELKSPHSEFGAWGGTIPEGEAACCGDGGGGSLEPPGGGGNRPPMPPAPPPRLGLLPSPPSFF
jgi:hypothetical protein